MDSRIPKPSSAIKQPATKCLPTFPQNRGLRRRSKSVTDLRTLTSKPLVPIHLRNTKLSDKGSTSSSKVGPHKRPLNVKNSEDVKQPKVPKVKIPDWDYKSRFHELQKKHAVLQEDLKVTKSKVTDFDNVLKERDSFFVENNNYKKEIDDLNNRIAVITRENEVSQKEIDQLRSQVRILQENYTAIVHKYNVVFKENEENLSQISNVKDSERQKTVQLENLKHKCDNLEAVVEGLKKEIEDQEHLRRALHNTIQDLKGNIRVFCRVRPPINDIERQKPLSAILFLDENTVEIHTKCRDGVATLNNRSDVKLEFSFDKVFPPEATQSEVFEELSQLVQSALDGFHVCVFAYGQTGSGKTYTMQGSSDNYGMIPRTIDLIFEKIGKLQHFGWNYTVTSSFIEIYNEVVKDLLDPDSNQNHELRYNEGRGVTVTNLQIVSISSAAELKNFMDTAQKNRAVAATDFNEHSSRSHAVTKIHLEGFNSVSKVNYTGSINLVDLAGSESAKTSAKERLTETKNINKSLSTLGNVMLALHNKDCHVPYRNSKLTFLLQSCLGGNSKSLMFVNISPLEECLAESLNSLRFAAKVKDIKTSAKRNKSYTT